MKSDKTGREYAQVTRSQRKEKTQKNKKAQSLGKYKFLYLMDVSKGAFLVTADVSYILSKELGVYIELELQSKLQ